MDNKIKISNFKINNKNISDDVILIIKNDVKNNLFIGDLLWVCYDNPTKINNKYYAVCSNHIDYLIDENNFIFIKEILNKVYIDDIK